jgi:hypothetical protein
MPHARQQIREACAALITGLTTTGTRVFQSRMRPQDALPCLLITTNEESIERITLGGIEERRLSVAIRGFAKASAELDDTLDTIAAEVETAMEDYADARLERIEVDFFDELEKPVGAITLTYTVTYRLQAGAPTATI